MQYCGHVTWSSVTQIYPLPLCAERTIIWSITVLAINYFLHYTSVTSLLPELMCIPFAGHPCTSFCAIEPQTTHCMYAILHSGYLSLPFLGEMWSIDY